MRMRQDNYKKFFSKFFIIIKETVEVYKTSYHDDTSIF